MTFGLKYKSRWYYIVPRSTRDFFVVTKEDLILSKLIWIQRLHSSIQLDDIKNLLNSEEVDMNYIKSWAQKLKIHTFDLL